MNVEEELYHSTLAMTKAKAVKWPEHTGSGDMNLFRRWLANRKRNADIDGRNKWEKSVWDSIQEMMRWKERDIDSSQGAPGKLVPSKPIPGSSSAFFSSSPCLLSEAIPDNHLAKESRLMTEAS